MDLIELTDVTDEPAPTPVPPQIKRRRLAVTGLAVGCAALGALAGLGLHASSAPKAQPPVSHTVVISVRGGAASTVSRWYDRAGQPHPVTGDAISAADLSAVLVSVTGDGDGGNPVSCSLTVDGKTAVTRSANAADPIVSCLWVNPGR